MWAWIAGGSEFAAPFQPMDIGKEPTITVAQGAFACLPNRKSLVRGLPALAAHWAGSVAARRRIGTVAGCVSSRWSPGPALGHRAYVSQRLCLRKPDRHPPTANDTGVANITVNLWRDGGDGVYEGPAPGSDDTLWATTTSQSNGQYAFKNLDLPAGIYYVQQDSVPGLAISSSQDVKTLVVTSYLKGTTIDSFGSTSQEASATYHGNAPGTSSESAPEAIGGNRNLYVRLTLAGGAVDLGANYDWPGLLDFGADAGSNGTFQVNWDGDNNNPAQLDPTGLDVNGSGLDITSKGASTGIELNTAADHSGGTIVLKVYTDANDWSSATLVIPNTGDGLLNSNDNQFVAFSSFQVGAGTGANFTNVGAIQLSIKGVKAIDGEVGPIEAVGPQVFSENFVNVAETDLSLAKSAASTVVAGQHSPTRSRLRTMVLSPPRA